MGSLEQVYEGIPATPDFISPNFPGTDHQKHFHLIVTHCIIILHFLMLKFAYSDGWLFELFIDFLHDFTLFVVDIHQIRLISLFRHFSDHFHFHPILEQKRVIDLNPCRNIFPFDYLLLLDQSSRVTVSVWDTLLS